MVEHLLKKEGISYKLIDDDDNFKLLKINSKIHMFYMFQKGNKFLLDRDFFDYLDGNSIPYCILCHDTLNEKMYYLKLNKSTNWVKSCFETCDKDGLYLGKNVMKYPVSIPQLQAELKKYK